MNMSVDNGHHEESQLWAEPPKVGVGVKAKTLPFALGLRHLAAPTEAR
jgi:hypothetical protein